MLPRISVNYVFDVGLTNTEKVCQSPLGPATRSVLFSYFKNLEFSKFVSAFFSMPIFKFTLSGSILKIVLWCSKEKVIGINARRVIAFVKHMQSLWNFTVVDFPRHSACWLKLSLKHETSISATSPSSNPLPALSNVGIWNWSRFVHLSPKPINLGASVHSGENANILNFGSGDRSFVLHTLVYATLSGVSAPRGHFHSVDLSQVCQQF